MTTPLLCLLAFALWTLSVVSIGIGYPRVSMVLKGQARPNAFPADQPHGDERYRRTMRAHANCVENLPVFGAVVLTAAVAGVDDVFMDRLAMVYLIARLGQTVTHIASGRSRAVNVRFSFFVTQITCAIAMGVHVVQNAAPR